MVGTGCKFMMKTRNTEWLDKLLGWEFFVYCEEHPAQKINEFCIDCNVGFCKHCEPCHCLHRYLQICRYCYHNVVRLLDMHKYFDCSKIQPYKINGEKAVHLNPKPRSKDTKPSTKAKMATKCEACGNYIQDLPNRFCSIACKVSIHSQVVKSKGQSHKLITHSQFMRHFTNPSNWKTSFSSDSTDEIQTKMVLELKPRKKLRKRKSVPSRAPFF